MSKAISSYPESMRDRVVDRRMRAYDPKGHNGIGTLAAKAVYDKRLAKHANAVKSLAKGKKDERK